MSEKIGESEGL